MKHPLLQLGAALLLVVSSSPCQNPLSAQTSEEKESKHLLWLIPNYGTSPVLADFHPLTTGQKFQLAGQDSWDRSTVALSAVSAGQAQLSNSNRSFGQGATGYARYLGTAYGDSVIGNYMTEALFPTFLRQDPRYFRRGTGSRWSRLGYAFSQTFVTHGDSGRLQPNYSEWFGNATAVAISNAYYPDKRSARDGMTKLGMQVGFDAAANILKEFCPDIRRRFRRKNHTD